MSTRPRISASNSSTELLSAINSAICHRENNAQNKNIKRVICLFFLLFDFVVTFLFQLSIHLCILLSDFFGLYQPLLHLEMVYGVRSVEWFRRRTNGGCTHLLTILLDGSKFLLL